MASLFSQYASGTQFTAGAIVGSATGASGLNQVVDRLNSISTLDNLVTGSMVSGTSTKIFASTGQIVGSPSAASDIVTKNYADNTFISDGADAASSEPGDLIFGEVNQVSETDVGGSVAISLLGSQTAIVYGTFYTNNIGVGNYDIILKNKTNNTQMGQVVQFTADVQNTYTIIGFDTATPSGTNYYHFRGSTTAGSIFIVAKIGVLPLGIV